MYACWKLKAPAQFLTRTFGTADTFFRTWQSVVDSRVRRRDDPCSTDGHGLLESYGVRQTCERVESSHLGEADPASYWSQYVVIRGWTGHLTCHDTTWLPGRSHPPEPRRRQSSPGPQKCCSFGLSRTTARSTVSSHAACSHRFVTPQMSASSSVFAVHRGPSRAVQRFSPLVMHRSNGLDNDVAIIWTLEISLRLMRCNLVKVDMV
jgi:hypothetical protein